MPDFDRMMYQTPFWSGTTTGGRDIYAPTRKSVTSGPVDRWVLPQFDTGEGGWPYQYQQPAPPDPELRRMGFQQTGIFGGPAGRAELYRGPQTPPIGVPVGFSRGFDGLGAWRRPQRVAVRARALRAVRGRPIRPQRGRPIRGLSGQGSVGDGAALALVAGLFIGVPALISWLGRRR